MKRTIFVDIECYKNLFYIGTKCMENGKRVGFEFSRREDGTVTQFDRDHVRRILRSHKIVGFNSQGYDLPMIFLALRGESLEDLKAASDRIIVGGLKWWEVRDEFELGIPDIDHIDLYDSNPSVGQSLKTLNGRLHGTRMQDLPYPPDTVLNDEQMDATIDYCLQSDLDATENVYVAMQEPLKLREALGERYGVDMRSKSDAQIGETIIKLRVEAMTGRRPQKGNGAAGTTFRYQVPHWMSFRTKQLQDVLETVRGTDFLVGKDNKVAFPKAFEKLSIKIGGSTYKMGIGGLHSTEANRAVHSDAARILVDADVASQYPRIIMTLGLYPKALGPEFLKVYGGLIEDRLVAKKQGDKVRDQGGKIALNGAYGKLGSPYSVLFAPHLMIAVTLTGQLSLLMLIEAAEQAGISVVSGNTDGVLFHCDRAHYDGLDGNNLAGAGLLKRITDDWMKRTGFTLEFGEYKSVYNSSVNSYIAVKPDGKAKRKGPLGNPWTEIDLRDQMKKNPQNFIISDAVVNFLTKHIPVERTIRECRDVRAFVTVVKATGGASWNGEYLGKTVRYYWAHGGAPIIKVKGHPKTGNLPKVSNTDGSRPLMTLPDELPDDIDYDRYIHEAYATLKDIGWKQITLEDALLGLHDTVRRLTS